MPWRGFSQEFILTLRLLKSYLRSRMGQENLTTMALIDVHKNVEIARFGVKNRRLDF